MLSNNTFYLSLLLPSAAEISHTHDLRRYSGYLEEKYAFTVLGPQSLRLCVEYTAGPLPAQEMYVPSWGDNKVSTVAPPSVVP